jgi:hypothetical protein
MKKDTKDFIKRLKDKRQQDKDSGFSSFYKENLPISKELSVKLINNSINKSIINDCEVNFEDNNEISIWLNNDKFIFNIDGEWKLIDPKGLEITSSDKNIETLIKETLINLHVVEFSLNLKQTIIKFNKDIELKISLNDNRLEPWYFIDQEKSYVISMDSKGNLSHIITCPESLRSDYLFKEKGEVVSNILYALDFYRNLIK